MTRLRLRDVPGRVAALLGLIAWSSGAVVNASLQVARDIVVPSSRLAPAIVVFPLRTRTAAETATVSGLITLTPGTLTVTVRQDPPELWVHGLYGSDPEALRASLADLESRVLRALRHPEPLEREDRP